MDEAQKPYDLKAALDATEPVETTWPGANELTTPEGQMTIEQMTKFLSRTKTFIGLSPEDVALIALSASIQEIAVDQVLLDPDAQGNSLLITTEKLGVRINDITNSVIDADSPLGEFSFLEGMQKGVAMPPSAKITAKNTSQVIVISKKLHELGLSEQGITQILINILHDVDYLIAADEILEQTNSNNRSR